MDHGQDIGAPLVDAAVNVTFRIGFPVVAADDVPLQREFHDIVHGHQFGTARPCDQVVSGIVGMAHAHMSERIHDALMRQYAVGDDDFAQCIDQGGHRQTFPDWRR